MFCYLKHFWPRDKYSKKNLSLIRVNLIDLKSLSQVLCVFSNIVSGQAGSL